MEMIMSFTLPALPYAYDALEPHFDKQGDLAMNEHKYLNTLAHVHQIREDLKVT